MSFQRSACSPNYMKRIFLAFILFCCSVFTIHGETPDLGPFTHFFFIDRWGQGVFGYHFVDPGCFDVLATKGWHPLKVDATLSSGIIPGGVLIQHLRSVTVLSDPKINIHLSLDRTKIDYGESAHLSVTLDNFLPTNHQLYRRNLYLCVTTKKRGTSPSGEVKKDNTYDSFINSYSDLETHRALYTRAQAGVCLFTDVGTITMSDGRPYLQIVKDGKIKEAGLYDEDIRRIDPKESQTLQYEIGPGWLVNEYELYAFYNYKDDESEDGMKFTMSKAISFDVQYP
jgi:hypothetical protein